MTRGGVNGSVELAMDDGTRKVLPAVLFGTWAVHQGPRTVHVGVSRARLAWQVTHAPTGMGTSCAETCGMTKAEAYTIARHLSRQTFAAAPPDPAFGRAVHREIRRALGLVEAAS